MNIVRLNPAQLDEAAAFIARLQADKAHQIAYFGKDMAEIVAAVQTFDPSHNVLLAYENDHVIGLLGIDTNEDTHRAWLYGPLVDHADWHRVADALYDEAKRQGVLPAFVRDEEMFVDAANTNVAQFAARHGFVSETPQASLLIERNVVLPTHAQDVTVLTESQHPNFIRLHDSLFPQTYFSGEQIIQRLGERDRVYVVCAPDDVTTPVGYVYARIVPEATDGYIEFLGVDPDFRRQGFARRLLCTAVNWLFSFAEVKVVALTVNSAKSGAIALYTDLGFTHLQTLQSYRKRD